jgi:hypothetical protein
MELNPRAYERDANALAPAGIDTYLVRYFTLLDQQPMDPKTSAHESRTAYGKTSDGADRISVRV